MRLAIKFTLGLSLLLPLSCLAFDFAHGSIPIELGLFNSQQGQTQDIDIQGVIGNQYTVNDTQAANGLIGLGYFLEALNTDQFQLSYGLNGYYFGKTSVNGAVVQEHAFSNLDYSYDIQNTPVYLAAKAVIKNSDKYDVTFDAGVGANFMRVSNYTETPTDNQTVPDNAFTSHNNVLFSAMTGVGVRFKNVVGKSSLECGYRLFYLGNGQLAKNNDQLVSTLKTGNVYANALVLTLTF